MKDRVILHCDLNNFYASVETLLHPELQGKPVAVCGDPEKRHGIVLAKSQPAKVCGVKTGEATWEAKQKCPDLIVVPPTYRSYTAYSRKVYDIYTQFTSEVESFGLDECWLDVTGCLKLFGSGAEIADAIRRRVKEETGGLTISVGVSFSKVFAKLGSDLKKPDAVTVIDRDNVKEIAYPLDVGEMLFVGRSTKRKLNEMNIYTIGDLASAPAELLIRHFGKVGEKMHAYATGTDGDPVKCYTERHKPVSVGNGTTTPEDITNAGDAKSVIVALSEMIAFRLRNYGLKAGGLSLSVRDVALHSFCRQTSLSVPTDSAFEIASGAIGLLRKHYDFSARPHLRSITVGTHKLQPSDGSYQTNFFDTGNEKFSELERSIDKLREKYGYNVVRRGITIGTIFTCDSREADDDFLPFDKNNKNLYDD